MSIIKAKTKDRQLIKTSRPAIASGSVNVDYINVVLDKSWIAEEFKYYASFSRDGVADSVSVELSMADGIYSCRIPPEMLREAGFFNLSVFAKSVRDITVKTSTVCKIKVLQGADTDGKILVDWEQFAEQLKTAIIEKLNEKFGVTIPKNLTKDEIFEAIDDIEDSSVVKSFFVTLLNEVANYINGITDYEDDMYSVVPLEMLSENMTDRQITRIINSNFQKMGNTTLYYLGTMKAVDVLQGALEDYMEIGGNTDRDVRQLAISLAPVLENLKNQYEAFRSNVIGAFEDDGNFTFDSVSSDEDIISAVNTIMQEKPTIVTAINEHFDTSIPTDSTAEQVAVSVAAIPSYSEGYSAAKAEDKPKTDVYDMFKTIYEQGSKMPSILTYNNGIEVPYSVPYINTRNVTTRAYISAYIQSCGFDLTSAPYNFLVASDSIFKNASELKHIKITNAQTQNDFSSLFYNLKKLESVELYGFNGYSGGALINNTFRGCKNLTSINFVNGVCTEELNFTGRNDSLTFYECDSLTDIRFVKRTIQKTFGFTSSPLLSKDSVLSIINGLDETQTGQTIRFHATVKGEMNNWYAKYNSALDKYVSCPSTDEGAYTFADIVTVKGWVLS